jgi:hypothetical protein
MTYNLKSFIFWGATPCSTSKVNRRFGGTCRLHLQGRKVFATCFMLVSCLAYFSTFNMEATCNPETSVNFQRTMRRYIPEARTLRYRRCENLKSYEVRLLLKYKMNMKLKLRSESQLGLHTSTWVSALVNSIHVCRYRLI